MKPIYIPREDHRRLTKMVNELLELGPKSPGPIRKLQEELNRAVVLEAEAIPPEIVTINSMVRLRDLQTDEIEEWVLTLPEHADPDQKRISVLAPVGTGLLGFSRGTEIEWETPGGLRTLKIEDVHQGAFKVPDLVRSLYGY